VRELASKGGELGCFAPAPVVKALQAKMAASR
jgi:hypothetical protein